MLNLQEEMIGTAGLIKRTALSSTPQLMLLLSYQTLFLLYKIIVLFLI
jgi:hypothetical protein